MFKTIAASEPATDSTETLDRKRHGRHEHRRIDVFDVTDRLGPEWDGLIVAAVRVSRLTWHKDTKSGLWHSTEEVSYYASQTSLSAVVAGMAIRQHWGIENRSHHVRDVSLFEDASRIRKKPGVFARFRTFALNIMRANRVNNISEELYVNALNRNRGKRPGAVQVGRLIFS